jgi:hypothetical protein
MGMRSAMRESVRKTTYDEATIEALNEKTNRADRWVEKWSRVPEIGPGLKTMNERKARNLAILLENQARMMSKLSEATYSSAFAATPENMIRLVRLAYPNSIRDKLFTEFAMETAKDSIKYIKPIYTANTNINRDDSFAGAGQNFNPNVTYESKQSRFPTEMANCPSISGSVGSNFTLTFQSGEFTQGYIPGYAILYDVNGNVLGYENKPGGALANWVLSPSAGITGITIDTTSTVYTIAVASGGTAIANAIGRYNSEKDLTGTYLGEVELTMLSYQFQVRPMTLGVTWTTLSELVLDSTVGVSTEEVIMDAAGQEIKKSLDFFAVKVAYASATTNGYAPIVFDAEAGAGTQDSYIHTAQTISQAIERVGDVMYNALNRGGVSRLVGGPAAVTYLRLNAGFTTKGQQPRIGGYQVGELYGIPVFKVPKAILPENTLMCVWKNENNEADVSVAFGTLVPFFSTGALQRKNFYKEAGLASFGDYVILNPGYFGLIQITNIRGL